MIITLSGGTGLIGNALGQRLVRDGHTVRVLARDPQRAVQKLSYPAALYEWDGEAGAVPREALREADALIHLAGENIAGERWTEARKRKLIESRLNSTQALAQAVHEVGGSRLVFLCASAVGIYGDRADEELTETSAPGEDFLANLCKDWEREARQVPAARTVSLRLGVVLSSGGGFLSQVVPLFQQAGASRLGSGRQYLSWVHIDDVAEGIVYALKTQSVQGPLNLTAPEPVSNAELTQTLKRAVHAIPGPPVPAFALQLMYGELSQALLGSQRARPAALLKHGFKFKYADLTSALQSIYPDLQAGESQVVFEQWVPAQGERVWEFFSSEANLERITPSLLQFHVLGKSTERIERGTLIDYRLKIRGVPVKWRTRIAEWEPPHRFADEQLKGPYGRWYHVHTFEPLGEGTLIRDHIRFRMPAGLLGRVAGLKLVMGDVSQIFAYRAQVISEIF